MGLDLNIGSKCAHTVDYNSDGWKDLLVCGEAGGLHLFRNDQGHGFTDVSSILGAPVNAIDAAMVDVNHDSRPDLITLTSSAVTHTLQLADGTFGPPTTILKVQAAGHWPWAMSTATITRIFTSSAARSGPLTRRTTCCSATPPAASPRSRSRKQPPAGATASTHLTTTATGS